MTPPDRTRIRLPRGCENGRGRAENGRGRALDLPRNPPLALPLLPVDLLRAYSKRCGLLFELVSAVESLRGADASGAESGLSVCSESPPRVWRVSDRLSEADVSSLVADYRSGTSARELAERYKIGQSSVKTLLRKRGVRRNAPAA